MTLEFENVINIQPQEESGGGGGGGSSPTGVGDVYVSATGETFTGNMYNQKLNLLALPDAVISTFPINSSFKVTANNVIINDSVTAFRTPLAVGTSPQIGVISFQISNGKIGYYCNFSTYKSVDMINCTFGESYDFEISYNGSGTFSVKTKLSSSSSWSQQTYSYTISSGYFAKNVTVGGIDTTANIVDVKVISNGNTLFERA